MKSTRRHRLSLTHSQRRDSTTGSCMSCRMGNGVWNKYNHREKIELYSHVTGFLDANLICCLVPAVHCIFWHTPISILKQIAYTPQCRGRFQRRSNMKSSLDTPVYFSCGPAMENKFMLVLHRLHAQVAKLCAVIISTLQALYSLHKTGLLADETFNLKDSYFSCNDYSFWQTMGAKPKD